MRSHFLGRFETALREKMQEHFNHVINGGCKTHEEYRERVGYVQGMSDALLIAEEVDKQLLGITPHEFGTTNTNH